MYSSEDIEASDTIFIIHFNEEVLDPPTFDRHVSVSSSQSGGSIFLCQSLRLKIHRRVITADVI